MSDPVALFSRSPSMREVTAFVQRAGPGRAGVMIRGEDGTGRRVVARAIHALQSTGPGGPGGQNPFITVDCAAFDAMELEVVLFGSTARSGSAGGPGNGNSGGDNGNGYGIDAHGLDRVSPGSLLDQANGGTLYLQNVTEAPARVQARLARVLRDREALAASSDQTVVLDVRPMTGVDPGVEDSVRDGRVREDLYRRLSTLRIDLPALRNRRDDIPELANHFLRDICTRLHTPSKTLSGAAEKLVAALPWRGNASELSAVLENAVRSVDGSPSIGIEDLLGELRLDGGTVVSARGGTLRQARARFEREYIAAVLEQHSGRISDTARVLGIQRTNLYRKMRTLNVGRIKKDTTPIRS
jgi:DNA-binding NtrC family response regulator